MQVPALIADNDLRRRDARFATQARHLALPNPLHNKTPKAPTTACFTQADFSYDPITRTCICPAGIALRPNGSPRVTKGDVGQYFRGTTHDGGPCALRAQCLRTPATTPVRNVALLQARAPSTSDTPATRMQARLDSPEGRAYYGQRFATVEPVFANLRSNKRLDRFTLRGRDKVDDQRTLYRLVHNTEKLAHAGYAAKAGGIAHRTRAFAHPNSEKRAESARCSSITPTRDQSATRNRLTL